MCGLSRRRKSSEYSCSSWEQSSTHMVRNQFGVHQMNDPWSDTTAKPPL
ncbi:predicted protein [Botrytis cinerea T4]|uniref:Uncharacterized protein n=1 Tax=Botryotinia fuckeliana (strain T4) TaxID=999810 RepID=G2YQI5_BOTF4|nr:predicted protein [Botrytis cinerea T4]